MKIGELVYVPSGVELTKRPPRRYELQLEKAPTSFHTTKEPINLIITRVEDHDLGVLYLGETWYVNRRDVYDDN